MILVPKIWGHVTIVSGIQTIYLFSCCRHIWHVKINIERYNDDDLGDAYGFDASIVRLDDENTLVWSVLKPRISKKG